jgi:hypothetical protein
MDTCDKKKDRKDYYRVREIAELQLTDALDMYARGSFVSSLTLAGAAEEILGKMSPEVGSRAAMYEGDIPNIYQIFSLRLAEEFGIPLDVIRSLMNKPRNIAKHHIMRHMEKDGTFRISIAASESMLIRCISQYLFVVDHNSIPALLKEKCSIFLNALKPIL